MVKKYILIFLKAPHYIDDNPHFDDIDDYSYEGRKHVADGHITTLRSEQYTACR